MPTFEGYYNPEARAECYRYADEANIKGQVCQYPAKIINDVVGKINERCAKVVYFDPVAQSPDQCIKDVWDAKCDTLQNLHRCTAFY